ncbi:MAG: poly(R)-hydroxyalkanoic acid synthase subunit PhaE [Pseudomonadota bacterium]
MEEKTTDPFGVESMMNTWTQSMNQIMGALTQNWSACQPGDLSGQQKKKNPGSEKMAAFTAGMKNWQAIASAMATPEAMSSLIKGAGAMPGMLTHFGQAVMDSFSQLQTKMTQSASRLGESVEDYSFENIDENIFNVWSEIYEKEFQKFFQVPQLGLTREYQEKMNDMMNKFNLSQANQAEFLRLLGLPFQRSMGVMQEKINQMAEDGALPEDSHEYYQMWIKILEGHFMTLFQTPEYIESLTKTIGSSSNFSAAKNAVLENMIKGLPIAQKSEMDDLAKELYELKRRIRRLEKENQRLSQESF